jgi:tetratricopeptide (TPR) repeat protein
MIRVLSSVGAMIRRLNESFVPALVTLVLIGLLTMWVDNIAKDFAARPIVIAVAGADADWNPESLTDDGIVESNEGPASDPAVASPELTEARMLSRAGDHSRAIAVVEKLTSTRASEPAIWNELGVYQLRAGKADKAVKAFDKAITLDPRYTRSLYNRAIARSASNDLAGARVDYEAVLKAEPRYQEARYNYGLLLLDQKDTAGAIRELTAAGDGAGNDGKAKALFSLGVAYTRGGETKKALASYGKAIEFRPSYLLPRYNQAALLMSEGRAAGLARAATLVKQLLSLSPEFAPGWFLQGRLASRSGDERAAMASYEKAARLDRRFWKAHYNWGLVALKLDDLSLAETLFSRLASEFPKRAEPHFNLGRINYKRERYAEAVQRYEKAIEIAGGRYSEAQTNLALALDSLGKYAEALAVLEKITPADVDRGALLVNRSLIEKHLGRLDAARASLEEAITASPKYVTAHYNLGKLDADLARKDPKLHEVAARSFVRALELDPKNIKAAVSLGVEFAAQRKWDEAIAAYKQALGVNKTHRTALFNLGIALKATKRLEEAAEVYRTLIAADEENIKAHQNLAVIYGDLGQGELAVQVINTALERAAGNVSLRYNLALQLKKLGRTDDARAELERSVALDPKYKSAAMLLSRMYIDLGRKADALEVLQPITSGEKVTTAALVALVDARLASDDLAGARETAERAVSAAPADADALSASLAVARRDRKFDAVAARIAAAIAAQPNATDLLKLSERLKKMQETP